MAPSATHICHYVHGKDREDKVTIATGAQLDVQGYERLRVFFRANSRVSFFPVENVVYVFWRTTAMTEC